MSLLRLSHALIDTFELRVPLDLGDGAIERGAVAFVLPVGYVLGRVISVIHRSPSRPAALHDTGFGHSSQSCPGTSLRSSAEPSRERQRSRRTTDHTGCGDRSAFRFPGLSRSNMT